MLLRLESEARLWLCLRMFRHNYTRACKHVEVSVNTSEHARAPMLLARSRARAPIRPLFSRYVQQANSVFAGHSGPKREEGSKKGCSVCGVSEHSSNLGHGEDPSGEDQTANFFGVSHFP